MSRGSRVNNSNINFTPKGIRQDKAFKRLRNIRMSFNKTDAQFRSR